MDIDGPNESSPENDGEDDSEPETEVIPETEAPDEDEPEYMEDPEAPRLDRQLCVHKRYLQQRNLLLGWPCCRCVAALSLFH